MDKLRIEPTIFFIEKISFSLKLFSGHFYGQSFIKTVRGPLDIDANKFYDRAHRLYDAALLTQCYTQHAFRSYIDSKTNHIRHFIKIHLVYKGIEFTNLPSLFKDKSVISSIPTYFEDKESPIICYKYNKPIRSIVFNYNKLVTEFDIEKFYP